MNDTRARHANPTNYPESSGSSWSRDNGGVMVVQYGTRKAIVGRAISMQDVCSLCEDIDSLSCSTRDLDICGGENLPIHPSAWDYVRAIVDVITVRYPHEEHTGEEGCEDELDNASYFENLSKTMPTLFGHGSFNGLAAMGTAVGHNDLDEVAQDSKSDLDIFCTAEEGSDALIQAEILPAHDGGDLTPAINTTTTTPSFSSGEDNPECEDKHTTVLTSSLKRFDPTDHEIDHTSYNTAHEMNRSSFLTTSSSIRSLRALSKKHSIPTSQVKYATVTVSGSNNSNTLAIATVSSSQNSPQVSRTQSNTSTTRGSRLFSMFDMKEKTETSPPRRQHVTSQDGKHVRVGGVENVVYKDGMERDGSLTDKNREEHADDSLDSDGSSIEGTESPSKVDVTRHFSRKKGISRPESIKAQSIDSAKASPLRRRALAMKGERPPPESNVPMHHPNSPARRAYDSPISTPRSAKSSLKLKRPSIRISNMNEPSTYRPDWRNLIVFKVSHAASCQSHMFSIEANVTTFIWRTVEFVCQHFELDSKGVRLYKEDSSSDIADVEVPVMRECKMDETMADVGTSDGSKFEIIFCED